MSLGSGSAMPLLAIDAMVIDTETTGLDARRARIVEVALVPIVGGKLDNQGACRRLVRPDVTIPVRATRVHGIDSATVAGAPVFSAAWPELAACVSNKVLIGHSVGFDLTVLEGECHRAGLPWTRPRALDTRLLAEIAAPDLPDYSLESLAALLEFEITNRHSALGDALAAGQVFLGLLPRLRQRGIRTLAEAERACRAVTDAVVSRSQVGWVELGGAQHILEADRSALRIDSYPYRHRVREVMSAPPRFTAPDASLSAVLSQMAEQSVSSLFVHFDTGGSPPMPENTGIITERDLMRAIARGGPETLKASVNRFVSRPLSTVPADAFAFLAIARMSRLRIRHLGVTDEAGRLVGALSARDLLGLRAGSSIGLADEIEQAVDVQGLAHAWAKLPQVAADLLDEGLSGIEIAALISHQVQALTSRAVVLSEQRMREEGYRAAPCSYVFAVLGSAGRGESLLAMDQDNALIFADGTEVDDTDQWFATLAGYVADTLHAVGVPYCKGGVMAKNPEWRGSVSDWRRRVSAWIDKSRPADLLSIDIFFDMSGVHGNVGLAESVWRGAFDAAKGKHAFAKLLIESAGPINPGLNLFGGFRTEQGRLDLKRCGLFAVVTASRALAICHHIAERSTSVRLDRVKSLFPESAVDIDAVGAAQQVFLDLLLAQQIVDIGRGVPPSSAVEVNRLTRQDRVRLRSALRTVNGLGELTRDLLFRS